MIILIAGSCSLALKCDDMCYGCSTTSIVCHLGLFADLRDILHALPPYTQAVSLVADTDVLVYYSTQLNNLTGLKILNITSDKSDLELRFFHASDQHVFVPLADLRVLKINIPWSFGYPIDDLFQPLVHLEELDLSQTRILNITNLRRALYGLSNSTTLETIKLSHFQERGGYFNGRPMYNATLNLTWLLEPLQNCPIRHLNLANNDLYTIYPGIIRNTPNLEYIDVSHNLLDGFYLDFTTYYFQSLFFQEILLHKGLQEVDCSYQNRYRPPEEQSHGLFGSNPRFPDQDGLTNRRRNLSTGTLQHRISSLVLDDVISEQWMDCDSLLSFDPCYAFSSNCTDYMDYLRHNHFQFCEFLYSLHMFHDAIPCSALPTVDDFFQQHCPLCLVFPIMGSIKRLKVIDGHIRMPFDLSPPEHTNFCFHPSNQLEYLDISWTTYLVQDFFALYNQSTITGLKHMKVLNVSNTEITSVPDNILISFPSLQVMDMSRNNITFYKERSVILSSNRDIQFLYFAHNQINFVPQNLFSNLGSLQKLDLSNNHIHEFDFNISRLYSLENLNLEYNMISEIPEATRQQLTQFAERIAPRVITVDLSNNQLVCLCSSIPSISFMSQSKPTNLVFKNYDEYLCVNRVYDTVHVHNVNLHSLWWDCLGSGVYVGIGFACASVVITIILLLAVTIYRKRWWFRYQYFLSHRFWKNYHKIDTLDTSFEYDLFVSYNHCDYQFVNEMLRPKLEDELGLHLCFHDRDFRLGEVITEQIIESIQSSKKTLFILSKSFLASTWCHFEVQMAQSRLFTTGKDVILLALLEPLPDRMVSNTLKCLLETRTYVEWTENDTYGQKLFWEKIYQSVKAPISQPFDLEERAPPPGIQPDSSSDQSPEETASETEQLLSSSSSEQLETLHQVEVHV